MIETFSRRRWRQGSAAHFAESFLEADQVFSGTRIAWRYGTARAGIAPFKRHFSNFEAHWIVFVFAEELVFPERGHPVDFQRGAEPFPRFLQRNFREQIANRLQRSCR